MKYLLIVFAVVISTSSGYAGFNDPATVSPATSGFSWAHPTSWSWTAVKEKVTNYYQSFFKKDSTQNASTSPAGQANPSTGASSASSTKEVNLPATTLTAAPPVPHQDLGKAVAQVKASKIAPVKTEGVPFKDSNLVMGHNSVPVFEFKKFRAKLAKVKVKKVPFLDPGLEPTLDESAFKNFKVEPFPVVQFQATPSLSEPALMTAGELKDAVGAPVVMALPCEKLEIPVLEAEKKVTSEKIKQLVYKINPDSAVKEVATVKFGEEDLKFLRGLILFEKKDQCHIASGIFSGLLQSKNDDVRKESEFHLGLCLHEMNLPTESVHYLTKIIRSGDERYVKTAVKTVLEDLQMQFENEVVEAILTLKESSLAEESLPQVNYLKSKYYLRKNQPQKALEVAIKVPAKHPSYYKAQYAASIAEYELDKVESCLTRQQTIATELSKKGTNKDILSLVQVNLGRVAFQKAKFKDSLDAYSKVPKEYAQWLPALTEQGWTQLQSKDAPGAIGNMHSIQSPYFDGVYKPESYIVRSIGYMNICQYADAAKSLAYLEFKYVPWLEKMEKFAGSHSSQETYQAVIKNLQGKSNVDVENMPFQVLREAARHQDFLNAQESINQLIDENGGYGFVRNLIEKDRKNLLARRNATIAKVAQLKLKLAHARSIPDAMKNFNAWRFELANYEDFLSVFEFKVQTLKEGADGFTKLVPTAQNRIAESKEKFRESAGKILKSHIAKMIRDLKQNLENNELLKYEIYAGSGENLRYKVAGGKTGVPGSMERKPAGVNWDFDGEYWEDEIGNYRSSLKNNCQVAVGQNPQKKAEK